MVIDRGMRTEGVRHEIALLRPACDADHTAALDARDLHGDLPDSARSGRDEHAIVRSQAADITQSQISRDSAQAERPDPVLDGAEREIEFVHVASGERRAALPAEPRLDEIARNETFETAAAD